MKKKERRESKTDRDTKERGRKGGRERREKSEEAEQLDVSSSDFTASRDDNVAPYGRDCASCANTSGPQFPRGVILTSGLQGISRQVA